ncbi:hypothetical protein niasHT_032435 [Heterodera trifolii]
MATLRFRFLSMTVIRMEESREYNNFNLLVDLGSTMGLYFGLTLLTVFELIIFFLFHKKSTATSSGSGSQPRQNARTVPAVYSIPRPKTVANAPLSVAKDRRQPIIIKRGKTMPIAFGPGEFFAAQKVYFRGISEPIDSLCHFSAENLCLLKYLEDGDALTAKVHNVMSEWLTNEFHQKLTEKEDFFLVTYFRHLIGEAKSNENAGSKMPKESAAHLGIFWEYLRNSQKNDQLWKRMRLADGQMMHLIDQLCQIEYSYLFNHDPFLINNLTESADDNLCSSWQNEHILAKKFADIPSVLSAFNHWIYFMAPIDSQLQLIVRSWVEQFVLRTAHNDNSRCWWDWPEFDLALFQEIGLFFANARNAFSLTSEKFARIDGIKQLLDSVCDNIKNAWGPCPQHSATFPIIQQWNTAVCVNGKLRYKAGAWRRGCCEIASPSSRKRSHQQTQLDNINNSNNNENEKDGKKCIICLEGERQFAFDPCGHLCCCEGCADKIEKNEPEPNCPICREIINKKIRIFHP